MSRTRHLAPGERARVVAVGERGPEAGKGRACAAVEGGEAHGAAPDSLEDVGVGRDEPRLVSA